jgi:hypothetical protein
VLDLPAAITQHAELLTKTAKRHPDMNGFYVRAVGGSAAALSWSAAVWQAHPEHKLGHSFITVIALKPIALPLEQLVESSAADEDHPSQQAGSSREQGCQKEQEDWQADKLLQVVRQRPLR